MTEFPVHVYYEKVAGTTFVLLLLVPMPHHKEIDILLDFEHISLRVATLDFILSFSYFLKLDVKFLAKPSQNIQATTCSIQNETTQCKDLTSN